MDSNVSLPGRKRKLAAFLLLSLTVASFLTWLAIDRAITGSDRGSWTLPFVGFSVLLPLMSLAFVLVQNAWLRSVVVTLSFLPSVVFVHDSLHLVGLALGMALVVAGLGRTRDDVASRIHVRIGRSLHLGIFLMVAGFALSIASHYYFQVRHLSLEELLPRFDIEETSGKLTLRLLAQFNPQLKQVDRENMTVDDLVRAFQQDAAANGESGPSDADILRASGVRLGDALAQDQIAQWRTQVGKRNADLEQQMALEAGRRQFSEAVGQPLTGQERVFDVLSQVMNRKLQAYFAPSPDVPFSVLPFILTVLLFLTLLSLGSFAQWLWIGITMLFFALWVRLGWVTIKTVSVRQEVIE